MDILKRLVVGLFAGLMGTVLIALAWTNIGLATIHNRQVVKDWFSKSNFYTRIVDVALNNIKSGSDKNNPINLPVDDPVVRTIANNALSPSFLKSSVETALDSTYNWLGSSEKDLTFSIDLTPVKDQLITGLGNYAMNRAIPLPVCGAVSGNGPVDPFAATCLPIGVTPAQMGAMAKRSLGDQGFLKNPVITASDIKIKDKNGNEVPITSDSRAEIVRTTYRLGRLIPLALLVLTLLLAIGITLLSRSRLRGLRRVGTVFLSTGIVLGLIYFAVRFLITLVSKKVLANNASMETHLGMDFLRAALNDVEHNLLTFVIAYTTLGLLVIVLTLIFGKHRKNKQPKVSQKDEETIGALEAPVEDVPKFKTDASATTMPVPPPREVPTAPPIVRKRPPRKIQW